VDVRPVDRDRIGIDQQLAGIEPVTSPRVVTSVGAQPVAGAGFQAGNGEREADVVRARHLQPVGLAIGVVEETDPYALR
jgi:hypothetical protein